MANKLTTAVLLTGAAARISQEVAIIDKLIQYNKLELNQDSTLLAGFSSGSLNIAAINACFRKDNPLSWDIDYKQNLLFKLKTNQVFKFQRFFRFPFPFNTTPLRKTLNGFLSKMGSSVVGDLAFASNVLAFSDYEDNTVWVDSLNSNLQSKKLSDVFMASTAIPVVFPGQHIHPENNDFPNGKYRDGGSQGTFINFEDHIGAYVKANQSFDKMYIISPMREKTITFLDDIYDGLKESIKNKLSQMEHTLGSIQEKTFVNFLWRLYDWNTENGLMAKEIFISMPSMEKNFPILSFDIQKKQYNAVCNWVENDKESLAIPLEKYLENHPRRK